MNIEEFVNDYLQEHRHDVLLNPYNGLVEFAKVFQEKLMEGAKDGWIDEECIIVLNDGTCVDLQPDYEKKPAFEFEYAQDVRVIVLPKEG